jgi:hypothetical protein
MAVAGWNVYTWRFTGPRLTLVAHDRPPLLPPESDRPLESWVLVIECRNGGRASTQVHDMWLRHSDGVGWARCELATSSSPLPATVEGHSMVRWIISASALTLNDRLFRQAAWG